MPLVPTASLLALAEEQRFALPAFNTPLLEFILWVLEESERLRAPVIIQVAPVEYEALDIRMFHGVLLSLSERFSIPFSLHLDHAHRREEGLFALRHGFSSVMIDGSRFPFADNVRITREVLDLAHSLGVLVEGELGRVGGLEGDEVWEDDELTFFTSPEEAEAFVRETQVDLLAVAVGTRHGFYRGTPKLDLQRLEEIRRRTQVPLVLHGGSGTPKEELREAIALGVRKINYSTALRVAYLEAFREILSDRPDDIAVHRMLPEVGKAVREAIAECILSSCALGRVRV
ncbi:MAG: class II fructose-bisphosphate aldolase [Candidatus Caldatribacterium sp.]|nr:class II fructose-bisphosphate aldolase [Candidatus Caldatribacterium sp.]